MNIKEQITEYLKHSVKNEFEILFNNTHITHTNFVNILTVLKNSNKYPSLYDNVNKWSNVTTSDQLDISIHPDINSKSLDLRWSINNQHDIQKYCKTENINSTQYELLYKKGMNAPPSWDKDPKLWKNSVIDEDYNLKYNLKTENIYDNTLGKFNDITSESSEEYSKFSKLLKENKNNFKNLYKTYRLKNRYSFTDVNNLHSLDLTVVRTSKTVLKNAYDIPLPVKRFIESDIFNQDKTYEIELEINKHVSSNLTNSQLKIKLDDIHKNTINTDDMTAELFVDNIKDLILDSIKHTIDFVYKAIHMYPHIISDTEQKIVSDIYEKFLISEHLKIIQKKLNAITKYEDPSSSHIDYNDYEKQYIKQIIKNEKVIDLKTKYTTLLDSINNNNYRINRKKQFIGPKPVSIELEHFQYTNENYILDKNYCVTDKADGDGKLLYVLSTDHLSGKDLVKYETMLGESLSYNNKVYLIDSNLKIYNTGLICNNFPNSLFNTEYLKKDINDNPLNQVMIYDTYFIKGENCQQNKLYSNVSLDSYNTRIESAKLFIDTAELTTLSDTIHDTQLTIKVKRFLDVTHNFSKQCETIWKNTPDSIYKYDGLIFTSMDEPVGFNPYNNDYDLDTSITWYSNIKWKPPLENTIDFLIQKDTSDDNIISDISTNSDGIKTIKKYQIFNLLVGKNSINMNDCDTQFKNYRKSNSIYIASVFKPNQPHKQNIHQAYVEICPKTKKCFCKHWNTNNDQWEKTNTMINDDTIIEFAYDLNSDLPDNFKWVPIKIRNDKTLSYKKGINEQKKVYNIIKHLVSLTDIHYKKDLYNKIHKYLIKIPKLKNISFQTFTEYKSFIQMYFNEPGVISVNINYGNNYNIADNIWKTIHNPVNEEIIFNIPDNIPSEIDNDSKYYNKETSNPRDKSLTFSLQEFHNKIIKTEVLLMTAKKYINIEFPLDYENNNINLLDLATGKGGDLYKWKLSNINTVVGIDNVHDNIYNKDDGACIRRNNLFNKNIKPSNFNVYFLQGDVSKNINNGDSFSDNSQILFNEIWNDTSDTLPNFSANKFHIISMMFAIHYMFKNEIDLDLLINNIDQNLKPGGLFIGTCLDGSKTFEFLSDISENDTKTGTNATGETLWTMEKKYSQNTFKNNDDSLDKCISIKMHSINKQIDEYLVNFEYLKNKLADKNIILLDDQSIKKLGGVATKSTDLLGPIYDTLITKSPTFLGKVNTKTINSIGKLSDGEKGISFLTRYFIFVKK